MSKVLRGQLVSFGEDAVFYEEQGALAIGDDGRILWRGAASAIPQAYKILPVEDHGDHLILPGFIDAHIHFPQYRLMAAPAKDLLDWLSRYTFPEEARYGDGEYARSRAQIFLKRLFANGTTAALAFCSVHKTCADALFGAALSEGMALVTGKTMMDRNAIPAVQDEAERSGVESEALYQSWHGQGRLRYAITPRFAITSTEAQLSVAGELVRRLPEALMQTHISESPGEIATVKRLFPNERDYTAVYERFGLIHERSILAHGIHLSESECQRLSEAGATIAHCPTSNNFLGSGLMSMPKLFKAERPVGVAMATDVGGGTSYSMLTTMGEAYKVQMMHGYRAQATEFFRMVTLDNAKVLRIDHETGSLDAGKFADVVVLDAKATPVLAARQELSESLEDVLFALMLLGDDRAIKATYVAGRKVYDRA